MPPHKGKSLRRQDDFDMARADVQEMRPEKILAFSVRDIYLRHRDEFLVFANVVGEAFVAHRVNFTRDNKSIGPNFY